MRFLPDRRYAVLPDSPLTGQKQPDGRGIGEIKLFHPSTLLPGWKTPGIGAASAKSLLRLFQELHLQPLVLIQVRSPSVFATEDLDHLPGQAISVYYLISAIPPPESAAAVYFPFFHVPFLFLHAVSSCQVPWATH
jgi:hypothetical protein